MDKPPQIHVVAFCDSLIEAIATHILAEQPGNPDLTQHVLLVTEPRIATYLKHELLRQAQTQGLTALLGPRIVTQEQWLTEYLPVQSPITAEHSRLLTLVEALVTHPDLLGDANAWSLAEDLLRLFDELTLNQITVPQDQNQFARQLARGYQLHEPSAAQSHEAILVHTLWLAWHTQLAATGTTDTKTAFLQACANSAQQPMRHETLHLVGLEPASRAELAWVRELLARENVHWWQSGGIYRKDNINLADVASIELCNSIGITLTSQEPSSEYERLLDILFTPDIAPLQQRVQFAREQIKKDPFTHRLQLFAADQAEQEAHAIDLQVRRWLLAGKKSIAIVSENRRLARRVRALLERAQIDLQDSAGWALSTTRAAAALEALLECIEEDFAHVPLLDLFKSSFIFADLDDAQIKTAIYRLEHDVIRNEKIARNIKRYRHFIQDRHERLSAIWPEQPQQLLTLLERLEHAGNILTPLLNGKHQAAFYIASLLRAMQQLQMIALLEQDPAGARLLQVMEQLHVAAANSSLRMHWLDFRAWLGRTLESTYFRPADTGSPVHLLSLAQAQLQQFDAMIIAGAEQEYLPGNSAASPFFNEQVRFELGLPLRKQRRQMQLRQFYRLLHSANSILITYRREQDGEWIAPAPWVEALESFYTAMYHNSLHAAELNNLLATINSQVHACDTADLPGTTRAPAIRPNPALLPAMISYSDYQKLMECPYRFFASRCLKLSAPEEVQRVLSKREYGERVHQCLQAFFHKTDTLPGPFAQPVTHSNRAQAIALLQEITRQVFAQDLQENFTHQGWYHQWFNLIPEFVDWQISRQVHWTPLTTEFHTQRELSEKLIIKGQIDRIDTSDQGRAIIDYKTGQVPSNKDVERGEAMQLPFYTLLLQQERSPPVRQAEYVSLDKKVSSKNQIQDAQLDTLTEVLLQQLQQTFADLHQQHVMPAWPAQHCEYCDMQTLCRKQTWEDAYISRE